MTTLSSVRLVLWLCCSHCSLMSMHNLVWTLRSSSSSCVCFFIYIKETTFLKNQVMTKLISSFYCFMLFYARRRSIIRVGLVWIFCHRFYLPSQTFFFIKFCTFHINTTILKMSILPALKLNPPRQGCNVHLPTHLLWQTWTLGRKCLTFVPLHSSMTPHGALKTAAVWIYIHINSSILSSNQSWSRHASSLFEVSSSWVPFFFLSITACVFFFCAYDNIFYD